MIKEGPTAPTQGGCEDLALFPLEQLDTLTKAVLATSERGWLDYVAALSPVAILISAVVAGVIAIRMARGNARTQREVARRRASLDVILKLESDAYHQRISATFRDVRDGNGLMSLLAPKSTRDKEEALDVTNFLNHYELIACGIKEDTLDEAFLYLWFRGTLIHHWHDSKSFIEAKREQSHNKLIFKRFEEFAEAWDDERFVTRSDDPRSLQNGTKSTVKQG